MTSDSSQIEFDHRGLQVWSPTGKPVAPSRTPVGRNPEQEPPAKAGARVEGSPQEGPATATRGNFMDSWRPCSVAKCPRSYSMPPNNLQSCCPADDVKTPLMVRPAHHERIWHSATSRTSPFVLRLPKDERRVFAQSAEENDTPVIEFHDVNKWFGSLHVLKDINLTVGAGEVVVVCGPSGSGG